jgi:hypothetical protein
MIVDASATKRRLLDRLMNTLCDDATLEEAMLGRWIGSSRGQTFDYTFHAKHYFTLTIKSPSEAASRVYGYWDIRDHALHIGSSEAETDSAEIEIFDNTFCIVAPGGLKSEFKRQLA